MPARYQYNFDQLPDRVRGALRDSANNPEFLIHANCRSNLAGYIFSGLLVLVCGFFLLLAAAADFGDPLKDSGWREPGIIILYAILIFGITMAGLAVRKRRHLNRKFGFLPGWYVFAFALVDANSEHLSIFDLMQLKALDATHHSTNGIYSHTMFKFNFKDGTQNNLSISNKTQAEALLRNFDWYRDQARAAYEARDAQKLAGYDPFLELRQNNWAGAKQTPGGFVPALKYHGQNLMRTLQPLAMLAAIAIGALFWLGRSAASDYQMHQTAKRLATEAAYAGYIAHGKFYVAEMQAALPRVAFVETLPKKSVSLLRSLKSRFPQSDIVPDVKKEIHVLYQRSMQKFQEQAVNTDNTLVATMEQLLQFAEQRDNPQVTIKFTRPTTEQLGELDAFLKASERKLPNMKMALASRHFANDTASVREARILDGLRSAFGSIFPNDVLSFSVGSGGKNAHPALDIAYRIEPSGSIYFSEKNKDDAFVGLAIRFQASIIVPEVAEHWNFELEVQPPNEFRVEYKTAAGGESRPSEGQVYSVMAERAFDQLSSKITAAFFRPDSAVFIRQMKQARQRPE